MENKERFFRWIRDRHEIYLKKEAGKPKPWTVDPIFLDYKFCNPFRENDKTTVWFRENIRKKFRNVPTVLMATIIFRWFNSISTGEILHAHNLLTHWDSKKAKEVLLYKKPLVTGAYIIKTPEGMNKLDGICWCIDNMWKDKNLVHLQIHASQSLQKSWERIQQYPYMGPFMAYEVITDLRHTYLLENAYDIMYWANPGPGAKRGLNRIHNRPVDNDEGNGRFVKEMNDLLLSTTHYLPRDFPFMEMRDIEHSLCEFDKYERIRLGEGRMKNKYNGRPDDQQKLVEVE